MPALPLGLEAYERSRGSVPEVRLVNLYLEEDKSGGSLDQVQRLQRPGLRTLVTFPAGVRGIFQCDGALSSETFVVAANKFYSTDWATFTELGTLANDGDTVSMAARTDMLGIVTAAEFWVYDGATLVQVDLPDDAAPIDIEVLNSYFILPLSNGRFYWLDPSQIDFSDPDAPLQFATAEANPDGLFAVRRLRDDLFFCGPRTIEVWQATGDADATFTRASGRTIDRGVQSRDAVAVFDNTLVFVGDDGIVYRISDTPQRISSFGIEERIRKRSDLCSAFVFTTEGHKFYCLRIPGEGTFAYDAATNQWCEFATVGATVWRVHLGMDTPDGALAADSTGKLFVLDPEEELDAGVAFARIVSGTVAIPSFRAANYSIALWVGCRDEATISLRWKDALGEWTTPRTLTARAGSDIVNSWRLGATRGAFRTFEISTVSPTIVRFSGATLNEARAT